MNDAAILVDEEILDVRFACDLGRCRGACCTMPGGVGAPLLMEERHEVARAMSVIRKYLPEPHLAVIDSEGLVAGSLEAPVTPANRDQILPPGSQERAIWDMSVAGKNRTQIAHWGQPTIYPSHSMSKSCKSSSSARWANRN